MDGWVGHTRAGKKVRSHWCDYFILEPEVENYVLCRITRYIYAVGIPRLPYLGVLYGTEKRECVCLFSERALRCAFQRSWVYT